MEIFQIFNPGNQTENELIQSFSIRIREFDKIMKSVKSDQMDNAPQHFIIQGVRGSGKTTLLLRLYYEIKRDSKINWLIPIIFSEEQYGVNKLFKLWEQIAIELENESSKYDGLIDIMQDSSFENYDEYSYKLLNSKLEENNQKICILWDNIGDFLKKLNKREQQQFREILLTNNNIRIIGGSSEVLEATFKYDLPFYEFFKIIQLNELKSKETREFLLNIDKLNNSTKIQEIIDTSPGKIEALRILTGGVPRTIVLLYEIFINVENGDSFKYLETLLDRVTPLYKHRMDDLATQQQEIVDCIAINWDAISVKEISKIIRLESKVISAQLRLLEKNNVVLKKATSTKNNLYQVKERFFNIWYIMRNGRKSDKKKVIWLTKFLEMWCDNETLDEMLENHISKLKKGSIYDKYAYHLAEAYASLTTSPEKQHQILAETRAYLKNCKSDSADSVSESDYEFLEKRIEPLLKQNEFEKAINLLVKRKSKTGILERVISEIYYTLLKDINKSKEFLEIAIKKGDITSMHNLAILYQDEFQDYKNAEKYFLMSIKHGLDDASYNLAVLYDTILEDKSKAEKYYLMAVKKGHLLAMNNLALLYHLNHDFEKAKDLYKGAIEKGNTYSMMNYANLLCENNKSLKEAEKYYLMAVRNNDINAMHEIALFYKNDFQDYDKSEKYFLLAIKNGHTDSLVSIANLYNDYLNEVEKSIKYYELAIEKGYKEAIFNLALLYDYKLNNQEKAEIYYLKSIENNNVGAINNLAFLYFLSSKNKENANDLAKKSFDKNPDNISRHTYSLILLWNNKIEDAIQISKPVFNDPKLIEERTDDVELLINMFIAKQQYNYVFKIFSENKYQIKDKLKPIYYALMHFMQDKYPDELKKMGEELEDTVNNIVDLILELRNKYK